MTVFPVLYNASLWLIYNYKFGLLNSLTYFTHLPIPPPLWQSPVCSLWVCFCFVFIHLFCFLDSIFHFLFQESEALELSAALSLFQLSRCDCITHKPISYNIEKPSPSMIWRDNRKKLPVSKNVSSKIVLLSTSPNAW